MELKVEHDPIAEKFYIDLGRKEALLAYTQVNNVWDIYQLIVPEEFRGQGIGELLALEAFQTAKRLGIKIIPSCPFLKDHFLNSHKEFESLITDGFGP